MTPTTDAAAAPVDEFDWIERCLKPLAAQAPEALGLGDDAAVIPARPGFDLVVSKDAIVEGVHFLASDPLDEVARKLLRVNLSDLAAKGAEPYGYFLAVAWPARHGWAERAAFAEGLGDDQRRFGVQLFGGDTVSTPGPLTASLTIMGWVPVGGLMRRSRAQVGDVVLVSGTIGDGWLGLQAAQGGLAALAQADRDSLAERYRRPQPRLGLGEILRGAAHAAADVSDGLIADLGHVAAASGVRIEVELDQVPVSAPARRWLDQESDQALARLRLATGGDDYEVICTAPAPAVHALVRDAAALGVALTAIGQVGEGEGVTVRCSGQVVKVDQTGYRHH